MKETILAHYPYIKFIHVLCVMIWGFYAISGWVLLEIAKRDSRRAPEDDMLRERYLWVHARFNDLVIVEHAVLPILLLTGAMMFWAGPWTTDQFWLAVKLSIVVLVFIPMEIYDIWVSHLYMPKMMRNAALHPEKTRRAVARQFAIMHKGVPYLFALIFIVIFLAVTKPFCAPWSGDCSW